MDSFKDTKMLFIGEKHDDEMCIDSQKELFNHLSKRRPLVLLLESLPLLRTFKIEELENLAVPITQIIKELDSSGNIYYVGWDDEKSNQQLRDKSEIVDAPLREQQKRLDEQAEALEKEIYQLDDQLDDMRDWIASELEEIALSAGVQDFEEIVSRFDNHTEVFAHLCEICHIDNDEKQEIEDKVNELRSAEQIFSQKTILYDSLAREINKLVDIFNREEGSEAMQALLSETFPVRVQSMADATAKIFDFVRNTLKLREATIVTIAGLSHFDVQKFNLNDKNYNLDVFYKELAKHKAAVLVPTKLINT